MLLQYTVEHTANKNFEKGLTLQTHPFVASFLKNNFWKFKSFQWKGARNINPKKSNDFFATNAIDWYLRPKG